MKKIKVSIAFKKYKGGFCPTPMKMRGAFAKGGGCVGGGGGFCQGGAFVCSPIWQGADLAKGRFFYDSSRGTVLSLM